MSDDIAWDVQWAEGALDETSRKILRLLQTQPELTVAEIGERVGLSHTPCWRRIKEMEKQGIISPANATGKREILVRDFSDV